MVCKINILSFEISHAFWNNKMTEFLFYKYNNRIDVTRLIIIFLAIT